MTPKWLQFVLQARPENLEAHITPFCSTMNNNLGNVAVEHTSFCQRLGRALGGVCFGFVLFVGSIFLLGWNEFNYVWNQAVLLKVDRETVTAGCTPSANNNGEPVWASCYVQRTYDFATDSRVKELGLTFAGDLEGAFFQANSQIYQWKEDKQCSSTSTIGGGKTKTCTYDYSLEWVGSPIDSSEFHCYPTMGPGCLTGGSRIRNTGTIPQQLQTTLRAPDGQVGMGDSSRSMYLLNPHQLGIFPTQPVQLGSRSQVSSLLPTKRVVPIGSGTVQFASATGRDTVGDIRTNFTQSVIQKGSTRVSAIAEQSPLAGGSANLEPWKTGLSGTMSTVNWAMTGFHSKQDMVDEKQSENSELVMILRLVGFVGMLLGLLLVTDPIALMPQVLPCVGDLLGEVVGAKLCFINLMISLVLSFTVIGAAWLMARPILGICIVATAAVVFLAHRLRKKYQRTNRSCRIDRPFMAGFLDDLHAGWASYVEMGGEQQNA